MYERAPHGPSSATGQVERPLTDVPQPHESDNKLVPFVLGRCEDAPIGVFDSGIGGLSVVRDLRTLLPAEDILYFADSLFCPYGTRDPEIVHQRVFSIVEELERRNIKLLVVACNTACAVALDDLRERFLVPIVGLEPAVKPAVQLTRSGRIGVLATPTTIASSRLERLIQTHGNGAVVERIPAPNWVGFVERGEITGPDVERAVRPLVDEAVEKGCDVLVLGCTHFPFLADAVRSCGGDHLQLVECGPAIARKSSYLLDTVLPGQRRSGRVGTLTVLTSGNGPEVSATASFLLNEPIVAEAVAV